MDSADWCIVCDSQLPDGVLSSSAFCSTACLLKAQVDAHSRCTSPVYFPPAAPIRRPASSSATPTATIPSSANTTTLYSEGWLKGRISQGEGSRGFRRGQDIREELQSGDTSDEQIRRRGRGKWTWCERGEARAQLDDSETPSLSTLNTSATDEVNSARSGQIGDKGILAPHYIGRRTGASENSKVSPVSAEGFPSALDEYDDGSPSPGTATVGPSSPIRSPPHYHFSNFALPSSARANRFIPLSAPSATTHIDPTVWTSAYTPSAPVPRMRSKEKLARYLADIGRAPLASSTPIARDDTPSNAEEADIAAVARAFSTWGGVVSSSAAHRTSVECARTDPDPDPDGVASSIHASVFRRHKERQKAPGRKSGVPPGGRGWGAWKAVGKGAEEVSSERTEMLRGLQGWNEGTPPTDSRGKENSRQREENGARERGRGRGRSALVWEGRNWRADEVQEVEEEQKYDEEARRGRSTMKRQVSVGGR